MNAKQRRCDRRTHRLVNLGCEADARRKVAILLGEVD